MKSPDEIKKGLEVCSVDECHGQHTDCPYHPELMCIRNICRDAFALIQQLEAERDAAIENIRGDCVYCLHLCEDMVAPSCFDCANKGYYRWEWRGVQKEE